MSLQDLYEEYGDRVQFLAIYVREAHPLDGRHLGKGLPGLLLRLTRSKAAADVFDPKTIEERRSVAGACKSTLGYRIPALVDEMDDRVNRAYAAFPTRLFLIGRDGRVAYAGRMGPWGFDPSKLGEAIEACLWQESAA